ncbi:hypothetical protein LINPERPRIM_LOCUS6660 [Linum perenne]
MLEDAKIDPRCPKISFSEEEVRNFYRPWSKALVVKVLEKTFNFQTIKRRLEILGERSGQIQVADAANNFFLVRFSDPDDYQRAAFGGPSNLAVSRIGNHIGKTVKIDMETTEGARGRFARVCVEVDISKPLVGKFMIEDRILNVEYESLENICFSCGHYGHKMHTCPSKLSAKDPTESDKQTDGRSVPSQKEDEGDLGVWKTVQRRQKGKKTTAVPTTNVQNPRGSRFQILSQEKENVPTSSPEPASHKLQQGVDPVIAAHAEKLSEILRQGIGSVAKASTQPASSPKPGVLTDPLADITNAVRTKKSGKAPGGGNSKKSLTMPETTLVSVPITYDNPVFQEVATSSAKVVKASARRGKSTPASRLAPNASRSEKKDSRAVRTFTPHPKQITEIPDGGEKKGDTPDKA